MNIFCVKHTTEKFRHKDRVQELEKKLPVRASQVAAITIATERRTRKKKQEREKQRSEFQWVLRVLHKWTCDLWHSAEGLVLTMLPSLPLFICPDTKSGEQTKLIWGCVLHNRKSPSLQSWKERTCRLDCTAAKKGGGGSMFMLFGICRQRNDARTALNFHTDCMENQVQLHRLSGKLQEQGFSCLGREF